MPRATLKPCCSGSRVLPPGTAPLQGATSITLTTFRRWWLSETSGTWTRAVEIAAPTNAASNPTDVLFNGISCSAGRELHGGRGLSRQLRKRSSMVATETSGTWAEATEVAAPTNAASNPNASVLSDLVSFRRELHAVARYSDRFGNGQVMAATETSGTWAQASEISAPTNAEGSPVDAFLEAVSCSSARNCTAARELRGPYRERPSHGGCRDLGHLDPGHRDCRPYQCRERSLGKRERSFVFFNKELPGGGGLHGRLRKRPSPDRHQPKPLYLDDGATCRQKGEAYKTALEAVGGNGPYTWKTASSVPKGLTLSRTGMLSGTLPMSAMPGTYPIKVQVTDATRPKHQVATASLKLGVT